MLMKKLFVFSVLAGIAGLSRGATPDQNVPQIVERSQHEVTGDWNHAPEYSFVERDADSKQNSLSSVKTYQVLQIEGSPYNRLIAIADEPLQAAQQAEEERKLRNEIQKRQGQSEQDRAKRVEKYLKDRRQDRALLTGMIEAFDFRFAGEEMLDGRDCWILDATPKPGYQPTSREAKVLAGMRGRLWVDKATYHWVKVQAESFQNVSLGFFAKVRPGSRFLLEQEQVAGGIWLPKHLNTNVSASAFGFNHDFVHDETFSNYKPMPETLALLGSR